MVRKIKTVEDGLNYAENSLNNVLDRFQTLDDIKVESFKEKVKLFSEELSCYLFFGKSLDQLRSDISSPGGLISVTKEVSSFLVKIGSLYVKITDFDDDGRPILDITKARFTKGSNGRYSLSLDDVIDHGDVNVIGDQVNSFVDAIKEKDTEGAIAVALDSVFGVAEYSFKIHEEIKDFHITKVFKDIFNTMSKYPAALKNSFKFKTVVSLVSGLVFTGIMLFVWIGASKLQNARLKEIMMGVLKNKFVKSQITMTVKLITDAMLGENVKGKKICYCIPLCCGKVPEEAKNTRLQDDLDALIAGTETKRPESPAQVAAPVSPSSVHVTTNAEEDVTDSASPEPNPSSGVTPADKPAPVADSAPADEPVTEPSSEPASKNTAE